MRTSVRHFAVLVPLVLIFLLATMQVQAQLKINPFDTAVQDSQFSVVFNGTANATEPHAYHLLSEDAVVKHEGAASLKSEWRVHATESWGGMNMLSMTLPTKGNTGHWATNYRALYGDSTYLDWSAGTHLSLWYNNESRSTAPANGVQMRFHIYEAGEGSAYYTGDSTDYEDWYYQSPAPINDSIAGWHELIIPLVDEGLTNSPNDQGFSLTGWSGKNHNAILDWGNIIGYTIEWTSGVLPGDTANGIVYYDDLRLAGLGEKPGYEALYKFNDFNRDTADFHTGWNNGGLSGITQYNETTDTLMGASVLGWDWKINVKEDWGGGCNLEYDLPTDTYFPDLSSKSELQFFVKVVDPLTCSAGTIGNKITMRFVLFDYSNGAHEEWYTVVPVRLDSVGVRQGWQMIRMPLDWIQSNNWGDLIAGRFNTPNGASDNILGLNKIGGFKMEFSSSRDASEPFAPDLVYSGKILFSAVIPAGFRETDSIPPALVSGVQATNATYSNIVTWTDVPGETGSTYTVYVSDKSFTDITDPGVENIPPFALPLNTQLQTHVLRSANTDQPLSLYYGVTATDKAGNTNKPAVIGPITNTAKGVPTLSLTPPTNFVADGDLSEWSGVTPMLLSVNPATPTCHQATNTKIDGDADLKVNAYLAVDATYLYVAFDVDDDVVVTDTTNGSTWLFDAPDLFIGLYDWRGPHHTGYSHGKTPDYHLRFCANKIIDDHDGLLLPLGASYTYSIKQITSGYTIEARIPWVAFNAMAPTDSVFSPKEGMRIPIDFSINDNDTPGAAAQQGIMCYSPLNNDQTGPSYIDVWRWTYTWI
ncbi:MAG: sugar-binding protein, partial [Bacteroidota bacterium]